MGAKFKWLRGLTVHGNEVESLAGYRQIIATSMPQLATLDFTRITAKERLEATHILDRHGMFKSKKKV